MIHKHALEMRTCTWNMSFKYTLCTSLLSTTFPYSITIGSQTRIESTNNFATLRLIRENRNKPRRFLIGRNPRIVAAVAIYIVGKKLGAKLSQYKLAVAAETSVETLRRNLKRIKLIFSLVNKLEILLRGTKDAENS